MVEAWISETPLSSGGQPIKLRRPGADGVHEPEVLWRSTTGSWHAAHVHTFGTNLLN